jgi:hypothetical protein
MIYISPSFIALLPERVISMQHINDRNWGRMFIRICPYLPFSARVCLNLHHWLANRMRAEGIDFRQNNVQCIPQMQSSTQTLAIGRLLTAHDLFSCGQKWLACLTPFSGNQRGAEHRPSLPTHSQTRLYSDKSACHRSLYASWVSSHALNILLV